MSKQKPPKMTNEGQQKVLEWLQNSPDKEEIINFLKKNRSFASEPDFNALNNMAELTEEEKAFFREWRIAQGYLYNLSLEEVLGSFKPNSTALNVINNSPVVKELVKRVESSQEQAASKEIILGKNKDTGEPAIFTLLSGWLTPYEKEIIESVTKFKLDGQVTKKGQIVFTLGQLYRALRHGPNTQSPTKERKQALLQTLIKLSADERKIGFKINDYLKIWGDFETNGGRLRILSFDEYNGRIRGQEDTLIVMDETPILCALAENLNMWEPIPQTVKAIKQHRYTMELKEPLRVGAKTIIKRSFATNEDRIKFCKKYHISTEDIKEHGESSKTWDLTENRIALRSVLLDFVYSYIRARDVNSNHSNKLPYATIFKRCNINTNSRETVKRAKADIGVIMTHLNATVADLKGWSLYTNKGSQKPDGIQITIGSIESGA